MYSNLFDPQSIQDLMAALPTIPYAIWETFYVTVLSTALSLVLGLPLGVLLVVGEKNGVLPLPTWLLHVLNVIINLLRSIPFLILMIMVFPLSRLLIWLRPVCARWTATSSKQRRAWARRRCRSSAR